MGAAQSFTTNAVSKAVNAYDFTSGSFNTDVLRDATVGRSALAGYLGSAAQTSVTAGLNWTVDGTPGREFGAVSALNNTLDAAANASIQYGMTGQTTLNVLSAADLRGGSLQGGLLESPTP